MNAACVLTRKENWVFYINIIEKKKHADLIKLVGFFLVLEGSLMRSQKLNLRKLGYTKPRLNEVSRLLAELKIARKVAISLRHDQVLSHYVVYQTDVTRVQLQFLPRNFMHLCGLNYDRGARTFFRDLINNHLDLEKVWIRKDRTTFQKLSVISVLPNLFSKNVRLVGRGEYLYLSYDYAVRTRPAIIGLALRYNQRTHNCYPVSLLNLKLEKNFPKGDRVLEFVIQN